VAPAIPGAFAREAIMAMARFRPQAGFTLIELLIAVAVIGILAAIALGQYRDYTRRARMSEVILATGHCKTRIAESYLSLPSPPASAGAWGCELPETTRYVGAVQTSLDGAIRIKIDHLDPVVNGQYVFLVPTRNNGSALTVATDLGNSVPRWLCGSNSPPVRQALPSDCREDATPYASDDYE
jgi:type IV pilus assembly protein PilA